MLYILAYDIPQDRRRNKLADLLLNYGTRCQYSVFEADLDEKHLDELLQQAALLLDPREDSFRVYPLCGHCRKKIRSLGREPLRDPVEEDFLIL